MNVEKTNRDFGWALNVLKDGGKVCRAGWNGKGLWLQMYFPVAWKEQRPVWAADMMTLPFIYMCYPSTPASDTAPANHINAKVPWLASQADMLAEDWKISE